MMQKCLKKIFSIKQNYCPNDAVISKKNLQYDFIGDGNGLCNVEFEPLTEYTKQEQTWIFISFQLCFHGKK